MNEGKIQWIDWLIMQPFGKYFVRIDDDFLENIYNFYGIRQKIANFKLSLDIIRGFYRNPEEFPKEWPHNINDYAICLYGLLHARYLLTKEGQEKMYKKYKENKFEFCPRTFCKGIHCLPYGVSDEIGNSMMQLFCPNCNDVYYINDEVCQVIDGAFFGSSWVHVFLQRYKELIPSEPPEKYIPRMFGYRMYVEGEDEDECED